jgi:hypothetical protein
VSKEYDTGADVLGVAWAEGLGDRSEYGLSWRGEAREE